MFSLINNPHKNLTFSRRLSCVSARIGGNKYGVFWIYCKIHEKIASKEATLKAVPGVTKLFKARRAPRGVLREPGYLFRLTPSGYPSERELVHSAHCKFLLSSPLRPTHSTHPFPPIILRHCSRPRHFSKVPTILIQMLSLI